MMLEKKDIICLSPNFWNGMWRNRQQIMSRLASNNNVFFIEPQRNYELSYVTNFRGNFKNIFEISFEKLSENLVVFHSPPSLPLFGNILPSLISNKVAEIMQKINNWIFAMFLKRAIKYFKISKPIFFIYKSLQYDLIKSFDETLVCYYVYDELIQYPQNKRIKKTLNQYDCLLTQKADIVFTSSEAQCQKRRRLNRETYLIRNAVDFDHFNKALDDNLETPNDIRGIKHPIIGYLGFLGFQIDVDLLSYLAKTHGEWSIVLVGPDKLTKDNRYYILKEMDNVFFLGQKELDLLPNYLKAFDVAIMPYDLSTHMATSYPLKLHEYLAAGKPIVSVNMPELEPCRDVVYLSQNAGEFLSNIRLALEENTYDKVQKRVEVARKNTWDNKVEEISRLIEKRLSDKSER